MLTEDNYIFNCPHCNQSIIVKKDEINCCIFRHGVFKSTGIQIDPHLQKDICENLYSSGLIYGCGNPFRLVINKSSEEKETIEAIICDYI